MFLGVNRIINTGIVKNEQNTIAFLNIVINDVLNNGLKFSKSIFINKLDTENITIIILIINNEKDTLEITFIFEFAHHIVGIKNKSNII